MGDEEKFLEDDVTAEAEETQREKTGFLPGILILRNQFYDFVANHSARCSHRSRSALAGQTVMLHGKAQHIAMRAAPKAVVKLLVVIDRERRRFFFMERATRFVLPPGACNLDPLANNIGQREPVTDLVKKTRWNRHPRPLSFRTCVSTEESLP